MTITHEITLDMVCQEQMPRFQVKQGDAFTRQVAVTLLANGEAWTPPEGASAVIRYHAQDVESGNGASGIFDTLPDGTAAWSLSENVLTLTLIPQMLASFGIVRVDAAFYDGDNVLATATFEIYVNRAPAKGIDAEAGNYYKVATLDSLNVWLEEKQAYIEETMETVSNRGREEVLLEGEVTTDSYYVAVAYEEPVGYSRISVTLNIVGDDTNTETCPVRMMINDDGPVAQIDGAMGKMSTQVDIEAFASGHSLISCRNGEENRMDLQRHSVNFAGGLENIWIFAPGNEAKFGAGTSLKITGIRA